MANLDMSDALDDPDLLSAFVVKRNLETVAADTGLSKFSVSLFPAVGVVCAASGNSLSRLPEADRAGRHISIVSKFQLRGPSKNADGSKQWKPDIVVWEGNEYVVKLLEPYRQYGAGFMQAVAGSVEMIEVVS